MGTNSPFLLAQSAEVAGKGIGLLQLVIQGGAALILAVVYVILGAAFYKLLMRSHVQEKERLQQTQDAAAAALVAQEKLLREQLDRERETTEVVLTTVQSVERTKKTCDELASQVGLLIEKIRDLEEAVRRSHNA